MLSKHRN